MAAISSGLKNLVIGDCHSSSLILIQAMPRAPKRPANSVRSSRSLREKPPHPLALIALTTPPLSMADWNTLNPQPRRVSVRSTSSRPKRVSGRSVPKRRMASS